MTVNKHSKNRYIRAVGPVDDRVHALTGCNARHTDAHGFAAYLRELVSLQCPPKRLQHRHGSLGGHADQHHGKLFAAITEHHVLMTKRTTHESCELHQHFVAVQMTVLVIDHFKVINI